METIAIGLEPARAARGRLGLHASGRPYDRSPGDPLAALDRWLGDGEAETGQPGRPATPDRNQSRFEASIDDFRDKASGGWPFWRGVLVGFVSALPLASFALTGAGLGVF